MEMRLKCKQSQIKSLHQRIDVLVEAEGHMKMEIETLKQQILEKQKETCQVELSSSNDTESVKLKHKIQEHGQENEQFCNREMQENEPERIENQDPRGPPCEIPRNRKCISLNWTWHVTPQGSSDPETNPKAEKLANDKEDEEERKALEEAIELLSYTG